MPPSSSASCRPHIRVYRSWRSPQIPASRRIDDAADVLKELKRAVAKGDAQAFREHAHALRSGAANIGARGIYEMCLAWRGIDAAALAGKGPAHVHELEQEFERVSAALQEYR